MPHTPFGHFRPSSAILIGGPLASPPAHPSSLRAVPFGQIWARQLHRLRVKEACHRSRAPFHSTNDTWHWDKQTTTWTLDTQVPQQELFDIFDISPRSQNRSGPGSFTQAATQMALRRSIVRYCIPGHASPLLCPNSRNHLNKSPSAKQSSRVIIRCTLSRPMSI